MKYLYLVEDVLHCHEEALSLVQPEFVVFVVATCKDAAYVGEQHAAVPTAVAALDCVRDGNLDRRTPTTK